MQYQSKQIKVSAAEKHLHQYLISLAGCMTTVAVHVLIPLQGLEFWYNMIVVNRVQYYFWLHP